MPSLHASSLPSIRHCGKALNDAGKEIRQEKQIMALRCFVRSGDILLLMPEEIFHCGVIDFQKYVSRFDLQQRTGLHGPLSIEWENVES
jgi:hypothetical protein